MKNWTGPLLCGLLLSYAFACAPKPHLATARSGDEAYEECHRLTLKKDFEKANECFELLKSRFSGSQAAYEADLEIADNHFRSKDYLSAADAYLSFTKRYPFHERVGYAYYRIGLSYLRENPKSVDRDQKYLEMAVQYFESALNITSGDIRDLTLEKWREAKIRLARHEFYIGNFYYKTGEYRAAIPRFQEVFNQYNGFGYDEKALYFIGDSFLQLKEKERALEILTLLEQNFPEGTYRKKLAQRIGIR